MEIKEINRLINKHLIPRLSGYVAHRDLIYTIENGHFLKGYSFGSTKGNREYGLSVHCFIQPLFVKSDTIFYSFGNNLTYKVKKNWFKTLKLEWWDARKEHLDESFQSILSSILKDGEKYLKLFKTPEDFYKKFKSDSEDTIISYASVVYTTMLLDDQALQNRMLKKLIDLTLQEYTSHLDFAPAIREEATLLLNTTKEERIAILNSWTKETLALLELPVNHLPSSF